MSVRSILVGLAVALAACGTEPGPMGFAGQYILAIDASTSCPDPGGGHLPFRHLEWAVDAFTDSTRTTTFSLPPLPDPNSLDDLKVSLSTSGAAVSGSLRGGARLDRTIAGGYSASFHDATRMLGTAASLLGRVDRDAAGRVTSGRGTVSGNINEGLFFSSTGGECTATDHMWSLTAQ